MTASALHPNVPSTTGTPPSTGTPSGTTGASTSNRYSRPIVVQLTARLLGIPAEDEDRFVGWVHRLTEVVGTDSDRSSLIATYAEITEYLLNQIAEKRQSRKDDLLSFLVSSADALGTDDQTLVGSALMFILAGTDTSFNAISSTLFHLATHDGDRRRLVSDPALIAIAVEEFLRYYARHSGPRQHPRYRVRALLDGRR